ncbi:hypothetical protein ACIRF8_18455 [Streptomyces sp. NPDC102406]|uniref:hypothetical protein n=1 Tax=Streptomyces sp. NPDC102406 TaxID=3366171 RepID=UPI003809E249
MTANTEPSERASAVRGLRRIRVFYTGGTVLWAASAAWTGWLAPGSRQMWVSLLLLAVFGALLAATSLWLSRSEPVRAAPPHRHRARPRPTATAVRS